MFLVVLVAREWMLLPPEDVKIWHVVFASIARMFASNLFLNLRHLYHSTYVLDISQSRHFPLEMLLTGLN